MNKMCLKFLIGSVMAFLLMQSVSAGYSSMYTYEDPGYSCYPNGTIMMANPDSTIYTSVLVTFNDGSNAYLCTVSGTDMIVITNCNLTFEVTVVFSDRSNSSDHIMGGRQVRAYILKCNPMMGYNLTINGTFGITLPIVVKQPVTPSYSISAGFFNQTMVGSPVYTARIGEIIDFTMMGPVEYYLRPLECVAYNNPSKASSTDSKTLIKYGCTMDDTLISNFYRAEMGGYFQYTAAFSVFKFYQTNDLYIECTTKVCPTPNGCTSSCDGTGRKRREVDEDLLDDESKLATIGRRLRIQNGLTGQATQIRGLVGLTLMMSAMVILRR